MKNRVIPGFSLALIFIFSVIFLPSFILGILLTTIFVYAFIEWLSLIGINNRIKIIYVILFTIAIFVSVNISRDVFYNLINIAMIFWILVASLIILKSSFLKLIFSKIAPIIGFTSLYLTWVVIIHMSSQASLPEINQSITNIFEDDNFDTVRGYFLFIIAIVSLSDIAGFLVGKAFGKNKLCETISPMKTIEGFIASVFIPSLIFIVYFILFEEYPLLGLDLLLMIMCCISCTIGDLFISILKRTYNQKDSGSLLPGHGGLLDRLDSYLPTTIIYYYWMFI